MSSHQTGRNITQQSLSLVRHGTAYKYSDSALSSDTVRLDCCSQFQISSVQPDSAPIPTHCPQCGVPTIPHIDPQRDRIERIATSYDLPYDVATFLYTAFQRSDHVSFTTFLATIKDKGLKPTTLVHRAANYNQSNKKVASTMQKYNLRLTITCKDCLATFRITTLVPSSFITPAYCVLCGSSNVKSYTDSEQDYYEVIAEAYDTDTDTIKLLIDCFGRANQQQFASFVQQYGGVHSLSVLCKAFLQAGFSSFDTFMDALRAQSKVKSQTEHLGGSVVQV